MGACCERSSYKKKPLDPKMSDIIRYQAYKYESSTKLIDIEKRISMTLDLNLNPPIIDYSAIAIFPDLYIIGGSIQGKLSNITFKGIIKLIDNNKNEVELYSGSSLNNPKMQPYLLNDPDLKYIFAVGGKSIEKNPLAECEKYSIEKNTWELLPKMIKPESSALFVEDILYAFSSIKTYQQYEYYDREDSAWKYRTISFRMDPEFSLESFGAAILDDTKILIIGGQLYKNEIKTTYNKNAFKMDCDNGSVIYSDNIYFSCDICFQHHAVTWHNYRYFISPSAMRMFIFDTKNRRFEEAKIDVIPEQILI